jgi:hypothetical protein
LFWDRAANGISQNPSLIKGSHGIVDAGEAVIVSDWTGGDVDSLKAVDVAGHIEGGLGG